MLWIRIWGYTCFLPPGSGSVIICMDSDWDPSIIKQKKKVKPWFLLFCDFYSIFEEWCKCMVPVKSKKQKTNFLLISWKRKIKLFFVDILKATDESVSKCYGSTTLLPGGKSSKIHWMTFWASVSPGGNKDAWAFLNRHYPMFPNVVATKVLVCYTVFVSII